MTSSPVSAHVSLVTCHLSLFTRLLSLSFTCILLSACASPSYYWQAARGHVKLMGQRQDVAETISDPGTEPALREKLQLTREILRYAEVELDLPAAGAYESWIEVGGPVSWIVAATHEFSLEPETWCFPVAGCVAYRGYFEREDADRFASRLRSRGLDVAVLPAMAYSTLGWFDDPLLDTMLERRPPQLAGALIHELAHQRLYVRGDTAFNEGYASFVEQAGVERWLAKGGRQVELDQWRRGRSDARQFQALLDDATASLRALYGSGQDAGHMRAEKAALFDQVRDRYRDLVEGPWQGRDPFGGWMHEALSNAHLAMMSVYTGEGCGFRALLEASGGDFHDFQDTLSRQIAPDSARRQAILSSLCPDVAPGPEL